MIYRINLISLMLKSLIINKIFNKLAIWFDESNIKVKLFGQNFTDDRIHSSITKNFTNLYIIINHK